MVWFALVVVALLLAWFAYTLDGCFLALRQLRYRVSCLESWRLAQMNDETQDPAEPAKWG